MHAELVLACKERDGDLPVHRITSVSVSYISYLVHTEVFNAILLLEVLGHLVIDPAIRPPRYYLDGPI
jgi:hypothetical protein